MNKDQVTKINVLQLFIQMRKEICFSIQKTSYPKYRVINDPKIDKRDSEGSEVNN